MNREDDVKIELYVFASSCGTVAMLLRGLLSSEVLLSTVKLTACVAVLQARVGCLMDAALLDLPSCFAEPEVPVLYCTISLHRDKCNANSQEKNYASFI